MNRPFLDVIVQTSVVRAAWLSRYRREGTRIDFLSLVQFQQVRYADLDSQSRAGSIPATNRCFVYQLSPERTLTYDKSAY